MSAQTKTANASDHGNGTTHEKRRVYERPQLIEYGPITQLTQGNGSGDVDTNGMPAMAMSM